MRVIHQPLLIRVEKKYGVCRHLQIPSPEDAVVLQTLIENLSPIIKIAQPSDRAYFSRSHSSIKNEADVDTSFPYPWWELWPVFQKRIYEFTKKFNYVVVTDIANYYDGISFDRLRNVISGYGKFEECLLDFLFYMLESFVWRPDYLPLSGLGLPQVNFDAPQLLAHCLLFEIDKYLNDKTHGNFVRWMDDIDFGVQDTDQAKHILKDLDELLLTRGLHLNMGKTKILSYDSAKDYFLPDENRYLSFITERIKNKRGRGQTIDDEKKRVRKRFKKFLKKPNIGRWEKVYNRYFTVAIDTKDPYLEKHVPSLLIDNPGIRTHICRYYTSLGPSQKRHEHLKEYLLSNHCADDTSIFKIAKVFVDWPIRPGSKLIGDIIELSKEIAPKSHTYLLASIWMIAKYCYDHDIASFLGRHAETWKYNSFLSRQVAAVIPRIRSQKGQYRFIEKTLADTGQLDALRVIYHLDELRNEQPLKMAERSYILHGTFEVKTYPLSKFLIAYDLLSYNNASPKYRLSLKKDLLDRIPDPLYKKMINEIDIK